MVATNFWRQTSSLRFSVECIRYCEWMQSICYSTRDSWVAIVGDFVEVLRAERRMVWPQWLPLSTSIISISHRRLLWAFTTVSVTVIHKVGLNKIRIVNCMFLPSTKIDVKKINACNLVGRWLHAMHIYALMLVQLISTAVDGTTLALHSV